MSNDFEPLSSIELSALNSASAELVTLAPGLRPERRFAPLARGLLYITYMLVKLISSSSELYTHAVSGRRTCQEKLKQTEVARRLYEGL